MSGGDRMYLEIIKRIDTEFDELLLLTHPEWFSVIRPLLKKVTPLLIPKLFDALGILGAYAGRTLFAIFITSVRRVDYVCSTSDFFPDVVPAFIKKTISSKTIWVQFVYHLYPHWRNRNGSKLRAWVGYYLQKISICLARHADIVMVINNEVQDALLSKGFLKDQVFVVHPGAPLDYIHSITVDNALAYDGVYLGRLAHTKGVFELIKIWSYVVNSKPRARLAIIGGGDLATTNQLKENISNMGLQSNVDLIGFVDDEKAYTILKSSKVFVFPSFEEGFGIVVVEALASGCHVVVWDLPVFQEYFSSFVHLVERHSIQSFSDAVIDALNEPHRQDENLEKFDWSVTAKKFSSILWGEYS